jgi:glucosamine--fructose-6-phosphate aminotransferase (isomerizing)
MRHQLIKELRNLSYNFQLVIDSLDNQEMVQLLGNASKIFILGRQMGHALALEGALKIKEVSYLHAEGYPGGALKHGPFALIENTTPIIILAFRDSFASKMHITAEEVKARGCPVILITDLAEEDVPKGVYKYVLRVNHSGYLSPLLGIVPLQYLAYNLSVAKGYNPDYPRNLAKCVTTE